MRRYIIERNLPDVGSSDQLALCGASAQANSVIAAMQAENKQIQWEHSYVTGDKTFCIYLAADEALIREHAERSGFPATKITLVDTIIDPVTAEGEF